MSLGFDHMTICVADLADAEESRRCWVSAVKRRS